MQILPDTSNLIGFFTHVFSINQIYELGWYAARDWMLGITGVLLAIAIAIRNVEEKIYSLSNGQTNYVKMVTHVVLIGFAIGLYFTIASVIIDLFNSIYGLLSTSTMVNMTQKLDQLLSTISELDFEVGFSVIYESVLFMAVVLWYLFTYCMLIFMIVAMRIAHACLLSASIFWGAVALPMSVSTGMKNLTSWKNICLMALFWPIIDAFLMYLVGGSFNLALGDSDLFRQSDEGISLTSAIFLLIVFSIINLLLIATTFSSPFVAQGLANGTGNVTGMIASFGAAGLSAGALIASSYGSAAKYGGGKVLGKNAAQGGNGLKAGMQLGAGKLMSSLTGSGASAMNSNTSSSLSEAIKPSSPSDKTGQNNSLASSTQNSAPTISSNTSSSLSESIKPGSPAGGGQNNLPNSSINDQQHMEMNSPPSGESNNGGNIAKEEAKETRAKKDRQARRGAIIRNNMKGKLS